MRKLHLYMHIHIVYTPCAPSHCLVNTSSVRERLLNSCLVIIVLLSSIRQIRSTADDLSTREIRKDPILKMAQNYFGYIMCGFGENMLLTAEETNRLQTKIGETHTLRVTGGITRGRTRSIVC
jgi:hypothetical protein